MTLREIGESVLDFGESALSYWDGYITAISTQNVLDWRIGHLVLTVVGGFAVMFVASVVLTLAYLLLSAAWEKSGLPQAYEKSGLADTMTRLDKMLWPVYVLIVFAAGALIALAAVSLIYVALTEGL